MRVLQLIVGGCLWCTLFFSAPVEAGTLTQVSDTISTSVPATSTVSHTIAFTITNAVPASGTIVITPENDAFIVPGAFDYTDADLAISSGGPFTERTLAAVASVTEDSLSVSGNVVTFTLNSSSGISSGSLIRIELGSIATEGVVGDQTLTNPSVVDSYRITIETRDASSVQIDRAQTMIAIVEPVAVSAVMAASPPNRLNGFPSGTVTANHPYIELSLNTDEPATCRYATSTDVSFYSMTDSFISWSSSTIHHVNIDGHANNTTYSYYVRCEDTSGYANFDDFEITFTLEPDPVSDTSVSGRDAGPGGVGPFLGGSAYLYLSSVTISGTASPNSTITVLKDGVSMVTTPTNAKGEFSITSPAFERGTYTFSTYVTDRARRRSSSYTSTLSFAQGTSNTISDVLIPPTVAADEESVGLADTVRVYGEGVPGATIELLVDGSKKFSASTTKSIVGSADGLWEVTFNANQLTRGTHVLRARATLPGRANSPLSAVILLGVGENPNPQASGSADLNGDEKINLIDFSILLSHWNTSDDVGDLNGDGTVNIADFSILLFNWTG